ncbi:hypothetical protein ACLKA6_016400, partial [Drosophila palustris]
MASWYRRFVPNFATLLQPMTELLEKGTEVVWEREQEKTPVSAKGEVGPRLQFWRVQISR